MSDGVFSNPGDAPPGWRQQKLRDNQDTTASPYTYPRYFDNVSCTLGDSINAAGTKWYGWIDLSANINAGLATANPGTNHSFFRFNIDKATAARASIAAYVITRISAANADLTLIVQTSFLQNDTTVGEIDMLFSPSVLRTAVVVGATPYLQVASNLKMVNVAAINTATPLTNGFPFTPAVGDIVVSAITSNSSNMTFTLRTFYGAY